MIEEGNIVAEYTFNGVRVRVSDSAYAGKSQEELDEIRKDARKIAWNIALGHEARKRAEREASGTPMEQ